MKVIPKTAIRKIICTNRLLAINGGKNDLLREAFFIFMFKLPEWDPYII